MCWDIFLWSLLFSSFTAIINCSELMHQLVPLRTDGSSEVTEIIPVLELPSCLLELILDSLFGDLSVS